MGPWARTHGSGHMGTWDRAHVPGPMGPGHGPGARAWTHGPGTNGPGPWAGGVYVRGPDHGPRRLQAPVPVNLESMGLSAQIAPGWAYSAWWGPWRMGPIDAAAGPGAVEPLPAGTRVLVHVVMWASSRAATAAIE